MLTQMTSFKSTLTIFSIWLLDLEQMSKYKGMESKEN